MNDMEKTGCVSVVLGSVIADLVIAFFVKWLWNWLLVGLAGFPEITYLQGFGIVILLTILGSYFKSGK